MSTINLKQEFIVEKGREIYYRIKPQLDKQYKPGYYVTIEANSGKFFVGRTPIEAMDKAKKSFPRRQFYMANIGRLPSMFK